MEEMKAFLLFKRYSNGLSPQCVVLAKNIKEAASKVGGIIKERGTWDNKEEMIFFSKSLFAPTKEDNDYFSAGKLLEYRNGSLYLCIFPEEEGEFLNFMEIPLFQ